MSDSSGDTSTPLQVQLFNARLNYTAASINTISYGIYLVLALMGMQRLLQRKRGWRNVSMIYSVLMFIITTAWYFTNNETTKIQLIEMPLTPDYGGSDFDLYCTKTNIAAVALNTLQIIGSDALLIYRAYVITNFLWAPILLPFIGWLAYIGLSVVANLSCTPLIADVQHLDKVVIAYYSLTAGCTMYCTLLICGRLIHHQRMLGQYGINSNTNYANLSAIMAESGLFYSVASVVNGVMLVSGDPNSTVASAVFTGLSYTTQAHIILRISLGVDTKTQEKFKTVSTVMAFGNPTRSGSGTAGQTSRGTAATGNRDSALWADKADLESAAGTPGEEFELKSIPGPGLADSTV